MAPLVTRPNNPPADLTFRDYKSDRALGRLSLYGDIADAAARKLCGLYGKSPSSVVRLVPFGPGAIDNSRGVFEDMCEESELPPLPEAPFNGGQCPCQDYRVQYQVLDNGQPFGNPQNFVTKGAIGAPRTVIAGTGRILFSRGAPSCPLNDFVILEGNAAAVSSGRFVVDGFTVSPVNGASDSCGSLPSGYPPPSATPTDLDGTTIINVSPNVPITVPVKIVPTFAPVVGIFKPEFNVNVGGVNVNISAGGFTFSPTIEIPVNEPYPYSDPRAVKPPSLAININNGGGGEIDLSEVIDRLIDIEDEVVRCCDRDAPHSPPEEGKVLSQQYLMEESIFQVLPLRTFQVTVDILTRAPNQKFQSGGLAPSVLYAGWFWFAAGNHVSDRMPVDSEFKVFPVPERITDSFACTLYQGYSARVTAFYIDPSE